MAVADVKCTLGRPDPFGDAMRAREHEIESVEIEPDGNVIRISGSGGTTGVLKGLAEEYSLLKAMELVKNSSLISRSDYLSAPAEMPFMNWRWKIK